MRVAFTSAPRGFCPRNEKPVVAKRQLAGPAEASRNFVQCRSTSPKAAAAASAPVAEAAPQTQSSTSTEDKAALPTKSKYAVIEIGGIQMFVEEGRWYNCNRLEADAGQTIQLGRVLAVKQDGNFNIGTPYLENAVVKAQIVEDFRGPKLTIFKMRAKKHYRRKTGHRQPMTQFYITEISLP